VSHKYYNVITNFGIKYSLGDLICDVNYWFFAVGTAF